MKPQTRDNLIYLAVGISIAGLVWADFFYAESHGAKVWMPSRFAFRAVTSTALLMYFVVREARKTRASLVQALTCSLFAIFLHMTIVFGFRQIIDQLPGLSFSALAVFEMFFVVQLTLLGVLYLTRSGH